jgi:hypothetical protein
MTPSSRPDSDSWAYRALRAVLHDVAGRLGVLRLAADLAEVDAAEMASFHRTAVGSLADLDEWLNAARQLLQTLERPANPPAACDVAQVAREVLSTAGGDTALEELEPARTHAGDPRAIALVIETLVRELRRALPSGRLTIRVHAGEGILSALGPAAAAAAPSGVTTITCSAPAIAPDLSTRAVSPLVLTLCTELLERQGGRLALRRGSANEFTAEVRLPLWGDPARPA